MKFGPQNLRQATYFVGWVVKVKSEKGLSLKRAVQQALVNFIETNLTEAGTMDFYFSYSGDESEPEKV